MRETALLFSSTHFDLSWPEEPEPEGGDPWGQDVAVFLAQRLPQHGIDVPIAEPYWGEGGWYLDVALNTAKFNLFVSRWPVGEPDPLRWVIQVHERRGLLARLLGQKVPEQQWMALRAAVDAALYDGVAVDARWMTLEELSSI